tara:strand:- start:52 stop:549 length:498 start_codon:yes stop_codon:yes gene_type:complete
MLVLKPMNQKIYNNYIQNAIRQYAEEGAKSGRIMEFSEALKLAKNEFDSLFPNGLNSNNQFLYNIINDEIQNIGIMWFSSKSNHGENEAFIYDIEIKKEYRGKGYGRESMKLLESKVKKLNLDVIGLHVFLHNEIAYSLYSKIGYHEIKRDKTGVIMKKHLEITP